MGGILDARNIGDLVAENNRNGSRHTHSLATLFNVDKSTPTDTQVLQFRTASKTWTPTSLTLTDVANGTARLAVIVCTSGTRPGSPVEGQPIYETDKLMVWNGVNWNPPWGDPWGIQGLATVTASQTGITTITDLTSLAVTFTAVANRRYRLRFEGSTKSFSSDQVVGVSIRTGSTTLRLAPRIASATWREPHPVETFVTPAAGSITYKASLELDSGGGADRAELSASATEPAHFYVEDVGPNGVPA